MEKVNIIIINNDTKQSKPSWNLLELFKKQADPSWHINSITKHITSKKANNLEDFLNKRPSDIFPPQNMIFNTFRLPLNKIKVIILGQDPYINKDQAMGMSFSVPNTTSTPPSLKNIFKEIKTDVGLNCKSPDLTPWLEQGVFLLNATLTVDAGKSNSHVDKGWGEFTDAVIHEISKVNKNCVFILWGKFAQSKKSVIFNEGNRHCIICSAHPSPLSANRFYNSKPFSITNIYLKSHNIKPINWQT